MCRSVVFGKVAGIEHEACVFLHFTKKTIKKLFHLRHSHLVLEIFKFLRFFSFFVIFVIF